MMKYLVYSILLLFLVGGISKEVKAETAFAATLSGAQQIPPTNSAATGFGRLVLNDAETMIDVYLDFSGLSGSNVGNLIHDASFPGGNGPAIFDLGGTGNTAGGIITRLNVTASQVADLKSGKWYFNVYVINTGAEIRGTIKIYAPYVAKISARQAVPPTNSTATAFCKIIVNETGTQISSTITYNGIDPNESITLLYTGAPAGANGGSIGQLTRAVNQLINITPAQAALIKSGQAYINVQNQSFPTGEMRGQIVRSGRKLPDYDGDGKADFSVFRTTDSVWYNLSASGTISYQKWGIDTDIPVPEDYDGDGKTDIAVWRSGPAGQAAFYILNSSNNSFRVELFGQTDDLPQVVGDYDGDGKADLAVYRYLVNGNQSYFFYRGSANNPNRDITFVPWGTDFDIPLTGDFNADGRKDFVVFRMTDSSWYIMPNGDPNGWYSEQFGNFETDFLTPADYDGDGQTDLAVYRPSAKVWYIKQSATNTIRYETFGLILDKPVPADYDGDGKTDVALWRFTDGTFYMLGSGNAFSAVRWGMQGDYPVARRQTFPY